MDKSVAAWQEDARRAFQFIATLYEQAQTAWDDAQGFFEEDQWTTTSGNGATGLAMSTSDLRKWPFAYLKAMGAWPTEKDDASEGTGALFGIIFYDSKRRGPQCVAGTWAWSDAKANCDHWAMLAAFGGDVSPVWADAFDLGPGPIHVSKPTSKARKLRPGVEQIRWFEIPLAALNSAERLREVVSAAQAMVVGDDTKALNLLSEVEKLPAAQ